MEAERNEKTVLQLFFPVFNRHSYGCLKTAATQFDCCETVFIYPCLGQYFIGNFFLFVFFDQAAPRENCEY